MPVVLSWSFLAPQRWRQPPELPRGWNVQCGWWGRFCGGSGARGFGEVRRADRPSHSYCYHHRELWRHSESVGAGGGEWQCIEWVERYWSDCSAPNPHYDNFLDFLCQVKCQYECMSMKRIVFHQLLSPLCLHPSFFLQTSTSFPLPSYVSLTFLIL